MSTTSKQVSTGVYRCNVLLCVAASMRRQRALLSPEVIIGVHCNRCHCCAQLRSARTGSYQARTINVQLSVVLHTGRSAPSNCQPWYEHCKLPFSSLPSDSATPRCGHLSSSACQSALPSRHSTRRLPRIVTAWGRSAGRSASTAAGYLRDDREVRVWHVIDRLMSATPSIGVTNCKVISRP